MRAGRWKAGLMDVVVDAVEGAGKPAPPRGRMVFAAGGMVIVQSASRSPVGDAYCWIFTPKVTTAFCAGASVPMVALMVPLVPALGPVTLPTLVAGAEVAAVLITV